tara:strand:- start:954 stop:1133 length:180 start_codon:yes stop_codon:yes gene_type:complete
VTKLIPIISINDRDIKEIKSKNKYLYLPFRIKIILKIYLFNELIIKLYFKKNTFNLFFS